MFDTWGITCERFTVMLQHLVPAAQPHHNLSRFRGVLPGSNRRARRDSACAPRASDADAGGSPGNHGDDNRAHALNDATEAYLDRGSVTADRDLSISNIERSAGW